MESLTARQSEILKFIQRHTLDHGVNPSYREIGDGVGIRSTNGVAEHINSLVEKGYVVRVGAPGRGALARALRLTDKAIREIGYPSSVSKRRVRVDGRAANDAPLEVKVYGGIAAGPLTFSEELATETLRIGAGMIPRSSNLFALRVRGLSMIEDGILDGDYVFVDRDREAQDGECAVVRVDGNCTLKRWYRETDGIRLQPANREMQPIFVPASGGLEVEVLGVVVGVWRRMQ